MAKTYTAVVVFIRFATVTAEDQSHALDLVSHSHLMDPTKGEPPDLCNWYTYEQGQAEVYVRGGEHERKRDPQDG